MKILITGGAGFIGSHLAEDLIKEHHLLILDNFSTGYKENIKSIVGNHRLNLTEGNIADEALMRELISSCDAVYHLAASVGVKLIMDKPIESMMNNIAGTEIILRICQEYNKRVILASTSEVYGKSNKVPFREDADLVLGPTHLSRWSYACAKAIDEYLSLSYYHQKKLPVTVVRFFNTVGPRQVGKYGMVIPRFIKSALNEEPITVYGDGQQVRCFGHVKDITKALTDLLNNSSSFGEVINLGRPEPIKIIDLAEKVKSILKSNSDIRFINPDQVYGEYFEDMKIRIPDIGKAQNIIKFTPKYNIDQIIQDSADYLRS